jgi:hypothetical protein
MDPMLRRVVRGIVVFLLIGAGVGCIGATLSNVPFQEEPARERYALIYIYRLPGLVGGAVPWDVALDDISIGRIRPYAYFTMHVAPGTHWLRVGNQDAFPLDVALTGAIGAVGWALAHKAQQTDELKVRAGDVYYLRLAGSEHKFLPREEAIDTLRKMKYDRGD